MEIASQVKFTVREPLNRDTLARVAETLESAAVPHDAHLTIVNFTDGNGFTVQARWTSESEDTK